jgi:serine/threonine-protein kinase
MLRTGDIRAEFPQAEMALGPGDRFGPYEVIELIGVGGMGEVYRARDTVLHRDVALKALPAAGRLDPELVQRFEREARLLASLNHPNIATLHGFESSGAEQALVMELVDGETLDDRLVARRTSKGGLPLKETLQIALQIVNALDAAHERGIVHRDLKPANIKIRSDGTVKVLDFGIAKVFQPSEPAERGVTVTRMAGALIGTPSYMSPEQARGLAVDKRTDVWAFGCVLYEMVSGKRLYDGEKPSDVVARVIEREPDLRALPADLPRGVRRLLQHCLAKDPRERLRDIADARLEIVDLQASADGVIDDRALARRSPRLAWMAAGVLGFACALLGAALLSDVFVRSDSKAVTRFPVVIPSNQVRQAGAYPSVAISPTASHVAYITTDRIYLRAMDAAEAAPVAGTDGQDALGVLFSPDGESIAFYSARYRELRKVPLGGGAPVRLAAAESYLGGSWGADDRIVFAQANGIFSVAGTGGTPTLLAAPDHEQGELGLNPAMLPGDGGVVFTLATNVLKSIVVQRGADRRVVVESGADARYLETGHLVYEEASTLWVVPFDVASLNTTGPPVPVPVRLARLPINEVADFAISRGGSLVYQLAAQRISTLFWIDREGRREDVGAPARSYDYMRVSPDGTKIAASLRDEGEEIYVWDIADKTFTRLTFNPELDFLPLWTPDSKQVVFGSVTGGRRTIARKAANGAGTTEVLFVGGPEFASANTNSLSPDGKQLLLRQITPDVRTNLWLLPLDGTGVATPLVTTEHDELNGEISPDGQWLAYQSDESGSFEVYIRPFPEVDTGKWQVSFGGGIQPAWSRDGRELFYLAPGRLMSVPIGGVDTPSVGTPRVILPALPTSPYVRSGRIYDVSPDGQRFLFFDPNAAVDSDPLAGFNRLEVVLNWIEGLHLAP